MGTTDAPSQACPACGELSPASARFCMHCAQPFSPQCPSCGKDVPAIARFCPHCAHALNPSGAEASGHVSGPLPSGAMAAPTQQSASLPSATQTPSQQAYNEGEAYLKAGHPEQALEAFERASQLDASNARAYTGKADALKALGRLDEADTAYDWAERLKVGVSGPVVVMSNTSMQSSQSPTSNKSTSTSGGTSSFANLSTGISLALIGGSLSLLAFFLPWVNFIIINISLFSILTTYSQASNTPGLWLGWLEPICAGGLILLALNAAKMGKKAHEWNLAASVVGLGLLIYVFVLLSDNPQGISPTSYLDIGYWLAGVGFVLGVVGAIKGQSELA